MLIHTHSQVLHIYHPKEWLRLYAQPPSSSPISTRDSNHTSEQRLAALHKRDVDISLFWSLSQISTPPDHDWYNNEAIRQGEIYKYYFHKSQGEGQYIYIIEDGIWPDHEVN